MHEPTVPRVSKHAVRRMAQRGVLQDAIEAALEYGRQIYRNGAVVYILGRREVKLFPQLADFINLHVICAHDGTILTTYRNKKLQQRCG